MSEKKQKLSPLSVVHTNNVRRDSRRKNQRKDRKAVLSFLKYFLQLLNNDDVRLRLTRNEKEKNSGEKIKRRDIKSL